MPNWVMNRIILTGKDAETVANKILSKDQDTGKEYMDFNNIDRMPESLNCICGSCTTPALEYYLTTINPDMPEYKGEKLSKAKYTKYLKAVNSAGKERKVYGKNEFGVQPTDFDTFGGEKGYLTYGKTIADNRANYGCSTWYEWSRSHWGVKWNASESRVEHDDDEVIIYFETPWDGVPGLMYRLAQMCKDNQVVIDYDFSEEQMAFYERRMHFEAGEITDGCIYEDGSKEAYEHFMEIWGLEDQFRWDEEEGCYKAKWLDDDE